MLKFFSASTSVANSRRAIAECIENALTGEETLDCDLLIIYTGMGHDFRELLSEARRLSPGARIAGCTGAGIIGVKGPDESMKALAIMAVKGPKSEFTLSARGITDETDPYSLCTEMAEEIKKSNPDVNMIHFLPSIFLMPAERGIEGIKSVFGKTIPVFGALSWDNMKNIVSYGFLDDRIIELGVVMIGFADPTLKYINRVNHGFDIIGGLTFKVTRSVPGCIYELNDKPAWNLLTETLEMPLTSNSLQVATFTGFARELPADCREEYDSRYILFVVTKKGEEGSFYIPVTCREGTELWLTRRDENKMFEGVEIMVKKLSEELGDKKPVAVFHADCVLRGRYSFNQVRKEELINRLQAPFFKDSSIPWLGLYCGGEIGMLNGEAHLHQMSSSLFVIYR